jgi:ABC-type Fe3+ transport system substrate-binding protein
MNLLRGRSYFTLLVMFWGMLAVAGSGTAVHAQQQWEKLVAAARKEGRLAVFGQPYPLVRERLPKLFKERYGIVIEWTATGGRELAARIVSEHKVNQYNFDATMAGATSLKTLQDANGLTPIGSILIDADVKDASKWKYGGPSFVDDEGQYIMRLTLYSYNAVAIHSGVVKPDEITWEALLDPKWKGKISFLALGVRGGGESFASRVLMEFGEEYFKRFFLGQEVMLSSSQRQLGDWLARGIRPIAVGLDAGNEIPRLERDGIPVAVVPYRKMGAYKGKVMSQGLTSGSSDISLLKNAPHPNAAKLFVNWLITKEGQELYNRAIDGASVRADLDDSWVPDYSVPRPKEPWVLTDTPAYKEVEAKHLKRAKELLGG